MVTSNFWPEPTSTSRTVSEFARFLADRGLDVRVATALPFYPQWSIWSDYRGSLWRTEHWDGIRVYRTWHFISPRPSTLTRMLHEATLSILGFPNLVRVLWRARVAYIVSPALSYAFTASLIATVLGVRRVLVVKDVMPEAAMELGMLRSRLMIGVSRWLARVAYALAHEIHTLGEGMRRRIAGRTLRTEKIRIVPDTIDPAEMAPVARSDNEFRRRFVSSGTFAVLHTGNMGQKQDLDLLLRTAERLRQEPGIHFYVFGDGAVKEEFLKRRAALDLTNVSHHPLQDRWLVPHMLSGADVVLVSQRAEVVDIVVPSKLITALGAGAMVVAPCAADSETARLVHESGGGIVTPPGDDARLAEVLLQVRAGQVNVDDLRHRARQYAVEHFGREGVYGPIADQLSSRSSLCGGRAGLYLGALV